MAEICDVCGRKGQSHHLMMATCDECLNSMPPKENPYIERNGVLVKNEPGYSASVSYLEDWKSQQRARWADNKAVADFTRVCEQTGLIDKLRKE